MVLKLANLHLRFFFNFQIFFKEQRLNQRAVEVNNKIHEKNGEQLQLRKKIEDLKRQLSESRYVNARKLYIDKMVERQVIASAIEVKF